MAIRTIRRISIFNVAVLLAALWGWSAVGHATNADDVMSSDSSIPNGQSQPAADQNPETQSIRFREQIFPLLKERCFECHSGWGASSGLRLDQQSELLGETTGEPLVIPKQGEESRLIQIVAGRDPDVKMPPEGKPLTATEVQLLRDWIDQGMDWDESLLPPALESVEHWAFQPIQRPSVPDADRSNWGRNPIDAFVAEKHREHELQPAEEASRPVLIRRLSLDVRGFPPTPEEVQQFLSDDSPTAYDALVDRLLDSPHYGERWGRHWLDVARWAESEGYESNHSRDFAWRYRDWVIDSFNEDRPFDQFLRQQLAGDEMTPYSDENLIATGFLAAARLSSNEEDKWLQRNAVLVDVVNTVGSTFLGLTINCAQCHNHKFDPITLRDYYRLQGFFLSGQPADLPLRDPVLRQEYESRRPDDYEPALALKNALFESARQRMIQEVMETLSPEERRVLEIPFDQRTADEELLARKVDLKFQKTPGGIERHLPEEDRSLYNELKRKIERMEKEIPPIPQTFGYYSPVTSPHELDVLPSKGFYPLPFDVNELRDRRPYLQIRGDVHHIGPTVEAGWPEVFDAVFSPENSSERPRSRADLADWLVDPQHPLTARVWVNRIWHYHFGRGIVATPGDFGRYGAQPTHPELLDWLASELIDSGWSTKHIHRRILGSATYRQSSAVADRKFLTVDPENEYLWHWRPRRLEAETLRDSMLAVSGEFDRRLKGPSVPQDQSDSSLRRSIYLFQRRGVTPEMQRLFDGPIEIAESCSVRHTSTTALQSLYLLNHEFSQQRATALAERILSQTSDDRSVQIETAFILVLGRVPEDEERRAAVEFLEAVSESETASPLEQFCHALLNLNEFAYLE